MTLFKQAIETKIDDPKRPLLRLIKFTIAEAKELIQHCIQLSDSIGDKQVISLMERRYGNPHTIVSAYRREIKKCPLIKTGDSPALKKFYSFLIKCQRITADITWNAVNTPNTLCSLLVNFPGIMKDRWNRLVFNLRRHQERDAEFVDLVNFVEEETILVTDPLNRWQNTDALDCFTDKEQRSDHRNREVKTYAIKADITGK